MTVEGFIRVAILTVVGGIAGAATFTHVHDWTMANSPPGTSEAFGWGNAVITELLPLGSLLEIRRRRGLGKPLGMPMAGLFVFGLLSLTAQVSEAEQTLFGWVAAGIPAVAFMYLVKMTLSAVDGGQGGRPVREQPEQSASTSPVRRPVPTPVRPAEQPVQPDVQAPVQAVRPQLQSVDADRDAMFWALVDELGGDKPSGNQVRQKLRCGKQVADRYLDDYDVKMTRVEQAV